MKKRNGTGSIGNCPFEAWNKKLVYCLFCEMKCRWIGLLEKVKNRELITGWKWDCIERLGFQFFNVGRGWKMILANLHIWEGEARMSSYWLYTKPCFCCIKPVEGVLFLFSIPSFLLHKHVQLCRTYNGSLAMKWQNVKLKEISILCITPCVFQLAYLGEKKTYCSFGSCVR